MVRKQKQIFFPVKYENRFLSQVLWTSSNTRNRMQTLKFKVFEYSIFVFWLQYVYWLIFFIIPVYLQSVQLHSVNWLKEVDECLGEGRSLTLFYN
jgi:hypothetical protein